MTPISRKYKKEYAFVLLNIAIGDLESAKGLVKSNQGRPENMLYAIQQSMEKCLKAVLIFYEIPILHTHDLEVLISLLAPKTVPPEAYNLGQFSQYASVRRYEEGHEEILPSDIKAALALGQKICDWAKAQLEV